MDENKHGANSGRKRSISSIDIVNRIQGYNALAHFVWGAIIFENGAREIGASSSCPAATVIYHGSVLNMPTVVKLVSDHSADSRNEISSRELVYRHFIIHIPRRVRFGLRAARGGGTSL